MARLRAIRAVSVPLNQPLGITYSTIPVGFDRQVPLIDLVERIEPAARYRHRQTGVPLL
jgi:hypothetical protein